MEIAVIGNSEFILGFRLAGIKKTFAAENDEKGRIDRSDEITKNRL